MMWCTLNVGRWYTGIPGTGSREPKGWQALGLEQIRGWYSVLFYLLVHMSIASLLVPRLGCETPHGPAAGASECSCYSDGGMTETICISFEASVLLS